MIAVVLVLLCAFFRSSETFLLRKSPFISSFRPRISENRANSQLLALATQSPVANAAINQPVNPEGDIRPTTTDRARTVTYVCTSGTLCTTSVMEELNGAPFGSYVDYILDEKGWPVMLLSDQSMHTQNIKQQPLVSLFCQLPRSQSTQSSAGLSRVTIMGEIERVAEEELATLKLAFTIIHPYAEQIADSPRFSFYKIRPKKIYFSGGFGVMATFVDVPQYEAAKPDVLAQEVANVLSRVNLEKQTELLLLCKTFLGIEDVEFVRVQAVDRLGIDLRVKAGT